MREKVEPPVGSSNEICAAAGDKISEILYLPVLRFRGWMLTRGRGTATHSRDETDTYLYIYIGPSPRLPLLLIALRRCRCLIIPRPYPFSSSSIIIIVVSSPFHLYCTVLCSIESHMPRDSSLLCILSSHHSMCTRNKIRTPFVPNHMFCAPTAHRQINLLHCPVPL